MRQVQYAVADSLRSGDIRQLRGRLGLTQAEFARLVHVSKPTVERWETMDGEISGPIVLLVKLLEEYPEWEQELQVPEKTYPMRLWYMNGNTVCTVIDVDEQRQRVRIYNYTRDLLYRAFGKIEKPTFQEYEEFLESRCFPRERDKMKLVLRDLDLPFYDPLMIIEKTEGRMAEDHFWIRIER